jgi:anti-anti-sigma factor
LLIDALDEALEVGARQNILQLIATRLSRLPRWLRIVATTRNDAKVLSRLRGLRARELDARDQRNLSDVRKFLYKKLTNAVSTDAINAIIERGDGNFRYVRLAVEGIESGRYSLDGLDELPPGLFGLYEEAFERLFPEQAEFVEAPRSLWLPTSHQTLSWRAVSSIPSSSLDAYGVIGKANWKPESAKMTSEQLIRVTQNGDVTVIKPADMVNERELVVDFAEQLLACLDERRPSRLLLNFESVRLFSSEAINAVLRAHKRIQERNGRMHLCGVSSDLRQVFRITGLDGTLFEIYDSCSEATEALKR